VERFAEPSLLLLLRERPMHGYELIERLPEVAGAESRVDVGNLYRLLRGLEDEGIVTSEWSADLPGPAKRTYELTEEGRRLLDRWAESLRDAQGVLSKFLERYEQGEGR
jgi:poly-beta-hydroxybutyrate-responsive repressor